jgi:hypothetical protein
MRTLLCVMLLGLAGCAPATTQVFGQLTLDGKPVPNATITFFDADQQTHSITTDEAGDFSLAGVKRGPVRVTVQMPPQRPAPRPNPTGEFRGSVTEDDNAKMARAPAVAKPSGLELPARYADPDASGLAFDLTAPSQRVDLAMTSSP